MLGRLFVFFLLLGLFAIAVGAGLLMTQGVPLALALLTCVGIAFVSAFLSFIAWGLIRR
jgi:hypothetical protein